MLSWSIGVGLFNAFQTFLEQMLCIRGYTDVLSLLRIVFKEIILPF